ncbi:CBS domain-containing protein [Thermodesulfobacteriota bacterium]
MDCNPPVVRLTDRIERILEVICSADTYLYYPVIDHNNEFQGVISLEDLKPILSEQAVVSDILVAYDLMTECKESVTPDLSLVEARNRMRKSGREFLPVVEGMG